MGRFTSSITSPMMSSVARRGEVLVAAFCKRNLRARHDQRHRHIESIVVEAEVHRIKIERHVGGGQIAGQLLFEIALAVFAAGMLEVRGRIIAGRYSSFTPGRFTFTVSLR